MASKLQLPIGGLVVVGIAWIVGLFLFLFLVLFFVPAAAAGLGTVLTLVVIGFLFVLSGGSSEDPEDHFPDDNAKKDLKNWPFILVIVVLVAWTAAGFWRA